MSAIIILPNRNKDINELISEMNDDRMQSLIKKMNAENEIALALPKFELEFVSNLNGVLSKLGMNNAFKELVSDFSGIREERNIHIDKIIQKTYLRVDEEGTEAVAVTGEIMVPDSAPEQKLIIPFIVDRPFLFMIRNRKMTKNYEMLFMSKIEKL